MRLIMLKEAELKRLCSELNEDMQVEILKRVLVKSICRFRCVCKGWNTLISSSFFMVSHDEKEEEDVSESQFLLSNAGTFKPETSSIAVYDPRVPIAVEYPKFDPIPIPGIKVFRLVDMIHGVVLVSPSYDDPLLLWNPTIRKRFEIPPSPFFDSGASSDDVVGLGFVSTITSGRKNYDFKVVRVRGFSSSSPSICEETRQRYESRPFVSSQPPSLPPICEVYSLQQGRWSTHVAHHIKPSCSLVTYSGCFANGSIHWIVHDLNPFYYDNSLFLLTFDCEREELKTMLLPRELGQGRLILKLFTHRGLLSVLARRTGPIILEEEIWTMYEYGVPSSWTKLSMSDPNGDDLVRILQSVVIHYQRGQLPFRMVMTIPGYQALRFKQPLMSYLLRKTLFLMDHGSSY